MKGIILSGGLGTRLLPLTKITSKQLLPIYNRPMIYYPLNSLIKAGIKEILIIVAPDRAGDYLNLLGSGKQFGVKLTYEIQDKPAGLPQAYVIGENFIDDDDVVMILGDNIFEDDLSEAIKSFKGEKIVEKPKEFLSDYALTGLYIFDHRVIEVAKNCKPSDRGELEIVDLHNWYLARNEVEIAVVEGEWLDAGTFESLYKAQALAKEKLDSKMVI